MRNRLWSVIAVVVIAGLTSSVWATDEIVSLYVGSKLIRCQPAARARAGVTYAPLRAATEAVGAHATWNASAKVANVCLSDRCVPIRQNQGIMVNGSFLIPVRLLSEALGRKVTWDEAGKAVRIAATAGR
jgi:hypothetical protein